MKIWRSDDDKGVRYLRKVEGRFADVITPQVEEKVRAVVNAVRKRGDRALTSYVQRFDLQGMKVDSFRLRGSLDAQEDVGEDFRGAVELALTNLRAFHEAQLSQGYTLDDQGGDLTLRVRPLESVGVYVPGGAAVYLSSLMMAVVPARIAGVARIAVATPPRAFLSSPHLRYLLDRLDIHEVYLMGGAHAVAALACGTESVTAVDKIVGPGGRWVAAAKKAVAGMVGIDMVAGPSEVVIVADSSADPDMIAADLLAQAEHDPDAVPLLVTTSRSLADKVNRRVAARLRGLGKNAVARQSMRTWGAALVVRDLREAAEIVNRVAPEHVELLVSDPLRLADGIERAGAIYMGPWSPVVLGDYVAGTNHVLPTAGAARFASPLGVWDFVRRTAIVRIAPHRYPALATAAGTLASIEDLPLHTEALKAGGRGTL